MKVTVLWLVNENQELLLARRADHKKQDPSVWGPSVTGKLEHDENALQALQREAQEELSLNPTQYQPKQLLELPFSHPDGDQRVFTIYTAKVPTSILNEIRIDQNEVASVEWKSLRDINELLTLHSELLVPSAQAIWPTTFQAMQGNLN